MNTFKLYEQLKSAFPQESAEALTHVLSEIVEEVQNTVTKQDYIELKTVVSDLAEAQKRTEQHVEELAEAQKRTEQHVEELAEAQKRTEQRVEELAEAQKRTEQRVSSLELAVERLAEAQKRTEETMRAGFLDLHHRLGVLGSRWGDKAEEAFRRGLLETVSSLGYTVEHYHGQDPEGFINNTARSFDLDVLIHNGEVVVAEVKSNASGADVTEFHRSVLLYERQTGRKANKQILVAVTVQEAALERSSRLGVIVATDFEPLGERK